MTLEAAETPWERGWDGHTQAQLRRLARLSPGQKRRWLEDAQRLVKRLSHGRDGSAVASDERSTE